MNRPPDHLAISKWLSLGPSVAAVGVYLVGDIVETPCAWNKRKGANGSTTILLECKWRGIPFTATYSIHPDRPEEWIGARREALHAIEAELNVTAKMRSRKETVQI
jgi:hypothetical protein